MEYNGLKSKPVFQVVWGIAIHFYFRVNDNGGVNSFYVLWNELGGVFCS